MPTSGLPLGLVRGYRLVTKPRTNTDSVTTSSIGDRRALHDVVALSLGDLHFIRSRVPCRARMIGRVGAAPGVCRESSFGSPMPTESTSPNRPSQRAWYGCGHKYPHPIQILDDAEVAVARGPRRGF